MKTSLYFGLFVIGIYLFASCDSGDSDIIPTACFEASTYNASVGETITFSNCSVDGTKYGWNFGDNTTSTEITPSHSYNYAGSYTVELTAYNKANTNTYVKTIEVTESGIDLSACFSVSQSTAGPSEDIHFTNCSKGASYYAWDFGDGKTSTMSDPTHAYSLAGTYYVVLKAYDTFSNYDSYTKTIKITTGSITIDPKVYDLGEIWSKYYYDDFSASTGDWSEKTTSDYSAVISGGTYTVTNYTNSGWFFWSNGTTMPAQTANYDIDISFKVAYDDSTYGDGLIWGLDAGDALGDYYYYRYTNFESEVWYTFGDSENGSWLDNGWDVGGNYNKENLLTIRKYNSNYYIFMNENYLGSYPFTGDYGNKFGIYVGKKSSMVNNFIRISTMSLTSKKSTSAKSNIVTTKVSSVKQGDACMKIESSKIDKLKQ